MKVRRVVIHHSASPYGSRAVIDAWHRAKGWAGIGYHYVINNGYPTAAAWNQKRYQADWDGKIETGRPESEVGAHVYGHNADSLGICVVGNFEQISPTVKQWISLIELVRGICARHNLSPDKIVGHRDLAATACPGRNLYAQMNGLRTGAAERARRALELRKAGAQYADIAATLGYAGPSGAYRAVANGLKRLTTEGQPRRD